MKFGAQNISTPLETLFAVLEKVFKRKLWKENSRAEIVPLVVSLCPQKRSDLTERLKIAAFRHVLSGRLCYGE